MTFLLQNSNPLHNTDNAPTLWSVPFDFHVRFWLSAHAHSAKKFLDWAFVVAKAVTNMYLKYLNNRINCDFKLFSTLLMGFVYIIAHISLL